MKKISLLITDLYGGGTERVVVNLANGFHLRGYSVDVLLLKADGELLGVLDPGIRVVDLHVSRLRWTLLPLVRYLRRERPSAILANIWPLTLYVILARWLSLVPTRLVLVEHTTWSCSELLARPTLGWQVRKSMNFFFPLADHIVAVSKGAADDLARFADLPRSSISVIYNPIVDTAKEHQSELPTAPAGWCFGSHKRVLAVGTLKDIKDHATLLDTFARLRLKVNARLLILGEGECRADLEAQIKRLGLKDDVFMPGFSPDPAPYFRHADLHVLTSKGEGFGNVIVEALAAGTPVVSTDCPSGPREILADGQFGRLVPVGDAQALATAMAESLEVTHDHAALMERAQFFSIDRAVDQYLQLLLPNEAGKDRR